MQNKLNIVIPPKLYNTLKQQAKKNGISMAGMARMILMKWADKMVSKDNSHPSTIDTD